ncbi:hypothetical protein BD779DRAFT_1477774 [Infundibulicybe gibba]|nr:hypothetical protein BD779DRAFT_1477774 [Infundibulicybe gibba]
MANMPLADEAVAELDRAFHSLAAAPPPASSALAPKSPPTAIPAGSNGFVCGGCYIYNIMLVQPVTPIGQSSASGTQPFCPTPILASPRKKNSSQQKSEGFSWPLTSSAKQNITTATIATMNAQGDILKGAVFKGYATEQEAIDDFAWAATLSKGRFILGDSAKDDILVAGDYIIIIYLINIGLRIALVGSEPFLSRVWGNSNKSDDGSYFALKSNVNRQHCIEPLHIILSVWHAYDCRVRKSQIRDTTIYGTTSMHEKTTDTQSGFKCQSGSPEPYFRHQRQFLKAVVPNLKHAHAAGKEEEFYDHLYSMWFGKWPEPDDENQAWAMEMHSKHIRHDMYWILWSDRVNRQRTIRLFDPPSWTWKTNMAIPETNEEWKKLMDAYIKSLIGNRTPVPTAREPSMFDDPEFPPAM